VGVKNKKKQKQNKQQPQQQQKTIRPDHPTALRRGYPTRFFPRLFCRTAKSPIKAQVGTGNQSVIGAYFFLVFRNMRVCMGLKFDLMPSHRPLNRNRPKRPSEARKSDKNTANTHQVRFFNLHFDFNVFSVENRRSFSIEFLSYYALVTWVKVRLSVHLMILFARE